MYHSAVLGFPHTRWDRSRLEHDSSLTVEFEFGYAVKSSLTESSLDEERRSTPGQNRFHPRTPLEKLSPLGQPGFHDLRRLSEVVSVVSTAPPLSKLIKGLISGCGIHAKGRDQEDDGAFYKGKWFDEFTEATDLCSTSREAEGDVTAE